jgi:hypothetical protein
MKPGTILVNDRPKPMSYVGYNPDKRRQFYLVIRNTKTSVEVVSIGNIVYQSGKKLYVIPDISKIGKKVFRKKVYEDYIHIDDYYEKWDGKPINDKYYLSFYSESDKMKIIKSNKQKDNSEGKGIEIFGKLIKKYGVKR